MFCATLTLGEVRPSALTYSCEKGRGGDLGDLFRGRRTIGTVEPSSSSMVFLRGYIASTKPLRSQKSHPTIRGAASRSQTMNSAFEM